MISEQQLPLSCGGSTIFFCGFNTSKSSVPQVPSSENYMPAALQRDLLRVGGSTGQPPRQSWRDCFTFATAIARSWQ
jgi:hypothetical protein